MELLTIVKDFYGMTTKEAKAFTNTLSENAKNEIIKGFKQNAKKAFYED